MYQAQYINPLFQLGYIDYELILTDDAGVLPTVRMPKTFKDDATRTDLDDEANRTIALFNVQSPDNSIQIDVPSDEVLLP